MLRTYTTDSVFSTVYSRTTQANAADTSKCSQTVIRKQRGWKNRRNTTLLRTLENHTVREIVVRVSRLQKLVKRGEELTILPGFLLLAFLLEKKNTQN
jgi:hypothetical protein